MPEMANLLSTPFGILHFYSILNGRYHRDHKIPAIPLEILLLILNELPKSTLLSFGRTSKGAWAVVEPLLYRSVTFQFADTVPRRPLSKYQRQSLPKHAIHSFFRAIRKRPARASYVKAAAFLTCSDFDSFSYGVDYPPPPDVKPLWLEVLDTLELNAIPMGISAIRRRVDEGDPDILVPILLTLLLELETLVADRTLLYYATGHSLMLKKVTIRNNCNWELAGAWRLKQLVLTLVCLSRLEHLSTIFPDIHGNKITHANLPALRTLKLTDHLSHPSAIRELLAKTPKLERLSYVLIEDTDTLLQGDDSDEDDLNEDDDDPTAHQDEWSAFATSLGGVARTLKILKIYIDGTPSDEPAIAETNEWALEVSARRGTVGSLRHLYNLTKLEIPIQLLLGRHPDRIKLRDILPPSLRKLYLRDDTTGNRDSVLCGPRFVVPALQSYLLEPEPGNKVLSLQELRLKLRDDYLVIFFGLQDVQKGQSLDGKHPVRRLAGIARQAGVKFTIRFRVPHGSFMSRDWECLDEVDEVVLYDPNAVSTALGSMETTMEPTRYHPTKRLLKKGGCFYNWTLGKERY